MIFINNRITLVIRYIITSLSSRQLNNRGFPLIFLKFYKATYGSRFYDSLSKELVSNLPNVKGLSPKNIRYIVGISSYELNKLLPKELKNSLPSIEELERKLGEQK